MPTQDRAGTAGNFSKIAMKCTKQWWEVDGKSGEVRSQLTAETRLMHWAYYSAAPAMRSKISVNSKAPALQTSSVCDMLDDTGADSASLENNSSGLHESLCRCVLAIYFLAENQFFLRVRKKDREKEQKQSLSKTEECAYAFNTALNKKGNKISAVL